MNEVVPVQDGAPAPARVRPPPLMAGGRPVAIVPQSMEECYRLANAICQAQMAPSGLETPEKAMVAIMHGLEIGLTPMAALQRIAVVNGRPTIWGDGAMSLVRASGLCEYVNEEIQGEGDKRTAVCEAKRKGETKAIRRTFSVDDAKRAGLWDTREKVKRKSKAGEWYEKDNDAPWYRYPERMMQMRARAFCLRDGFADVLGGLYLKEELDGVESERQEPQRRAPSGSAPAIEHKPEPEQQQSVEREPEKRATKPAQARRAPSASQAPTETKSASATLPYDPEAIRKRFGEALKACKSDDDINAAWEEIVDPVQDEMLPPDREDLERMIRLRQGELDGGGATT